jgi:uncharacterized protein
MRRLPSRLPRALPVLALLAGLAPPPAAAQGIECSRARGPVETALCASPALLAEDRAMGEAYRAALARAGADEAAASALRAAQRQWVTTRDRNCANRPRPQLEACLREAYGARLAALAPPGPATPPPAAPAAPPAAAAALAIPAASAPPAPTPAPGALAQPLPEASARLRDPVLPTAERMETLLEVTSPGRFALRAESPTGTAIQLVDMLAGPGELAGIAGAADGRLDLLLDRGTYKIRGFGAPGARGETRLSVTPWRDAAPPALAPRDGAVVAATLADGERRSFWLAIPVAGELRFEAAGRALADLRLWRDGRELVAARPLADMVEPQRGRPMTRLVLTAALEPGTYLLTADGGPGRAWSGGGDAMPLLLRGGASPALAGNLVRGRIGPMGTEAFEVASQAGAFRLTLPEPAEALLAIRTGGTVSEARLARNARRPELALTPGPRQQVPRIVELRGAEGQAFELRAADLSGGREQVGLGPQLAQLAAFGFGGDEPPASGLLLRRRAQQPAEVVASAGAIRVGPGLAWRGRFNLRGQVVLLVDVAAPGLVALRSEGVALRATLTPASQVAPPPAASGVLPTEWDLAAGWHWLRLAPEGEASGILDLTLGAPGLRPDPSPPQPRDPLLPLGRHVVEQGQSLLLLTGLAPQGSIALATRRLPLDPLEGTLVLAQPAGPGLELPLTRPVAPAASLPATGEALAVTLERTPTGQTLRLPAAAAPREVLLAWRDTAAPPLPAPAAEPALAELVPGRPFFLDLARGTPRRLALDLAEGGLWRIETLGRLRTQGTLGTAFEAVLDSAEANGIGQNLLLQRWLRAGRYRVTVTAQDSAGRAGVLARPAPLLDGGRLAAGRTARIALPAGAGAAFVLDIAEAGPHRLELLGQERRFTARLEDAEGWPLRAPETIEEPLELDLPAGPARLIVMPEATEARVIARLAALRPAPATEGHGPHPLPFDATTRHQWREPPTREAERVPDSWDFALAGPAEVTLEITDGMVADLRPAAGGPARARIVHRGGFRGELPAGRWRVEARSLGRNDRLDYGLTLGSREIQPDLPRRVALPATIPFAIAEDRVVNLTSFGDIDIRAVLRDAEGRVVARADDRDGDWNFALSRPLPAGRYRLEVAGALPALRFSRVGAAPDSGPGDEEEQGEPSGEAGSGDGEARPLGAAEGEVEIRLALPSALPEAAADLAGTALLEGAGVHRRTLPAPGEGALLLATAAAPDEIVLALERQDAAGRWAAVALDRGRAPVVAVPGGAGAEGAWRVAAWAVDGGDAPIRLAARLLDTPATEPGPNLTLAPVVAEGLPPLGVAQVALAGEGALRLGAAVTGLRAGSVAGAALAPPEGELLLPQARRLWLQAPGVAALALAPLAPAPGTDIEVALREGESAVLPGPAGPVAWLARTADGEPGLEAGQGMGSAPGGSAFALGAAGAPLRAWNAGAAEAMRLRLRAVALTEAPARAAAGHAGLLAPGAALPLRLPAGAKRVRLDLAPGTAAVLGRPGGAPVTVWSGTEAASRLLDGDWAEALLVNAGEAPAPVALALAPPDAAPLALGPDRPLRRFFGAAGSLGLPVAAAPGQLLVVLGATARFQGEDGRLRSGGRIALPGPGQLVLTLAPGPVAAWIEGEGATPWPPATPVATALPTRLPLSGAAMALALAPETPVLLQARTTAPVILDLAQGGAQEAPLLFPAGAEFHRYLAAGPATLRLLAPQDGPLTGWIELTASPVRPAGEGLGEPVVVAPGGSALFGFELARAARLGLGLRAEPDRVAVRLLDAAGREVAAGMALLQRLPPGRYLMEARVPADAATTLLRPAVIGLEPPPAGPPMAVVERYMELVGLRPTAPR